MRLFALLLISSAVPALADDPSAAIEVGRFGVMLDQAEAAEKLALPAETPEPDQTTNGIYRQLVATVLRYNVITERVCRREAVLPAADCSGPFAPSWLSAGSVDDPARLRVMIDEAGERIGAFWGDMCEKARGRDAHLCDIE